ncbi:MULTISPECIES: ABC transporter ATP-binding protein [Actinosynnema]|uniref:ABC transporter ATP-binding protein n=1 Tax=Actinosynnema TaxID=40566 RepID=UPI0020A3BA73|nr:ABC transporter ATP-binding protein [Actinosynnema pretiosum]MCP2095594.1 ATP-binding cassette, subfamily B [Actinosynnema pretiosum]
MASLPSPDELSPLRTLWSFARPHRAALAVALACTAGATSTVLATPLATKSILDGLTTGSTPRDAVLVLIGLLVLGSALGFARSLLLGRVSERIVLEARTRMVRKLPRATVGALSRLSPGELVTRVTSDTVLLREAAAGTALEFLGATVTIVGSLLLMAGLDRVLLVVVVGVLLAIAVLMSLPMRPLAAAETEAQAAIGRLGGALEGAMRAIRTVKASRAEDRESERILSEAGESARQRIRAVRVEALSWTLAGAAFHGAILIILSVGAWRVGAGAMPVSSLIAFLLYAFLVVDPVQKLTQSLTLLQSGLVAAARIKEVADLPQEEQPSTTPPPPTSPDSPQVLSLRAVTARYDSDAPVLNDVSVDIPRRGHTALVGPSGAGKTTVFSLLLRFAEPAGGELTLDGVPLDRFPLPVLRKRIAYVEQDTPLVPGTLRENLAYTHPDADEAALWTALRAVHLDSRARALPRGLDTPLSGAVLSGGERQRVALARALVRTPEILLLDEATAQLDGLTEAAIQDALAEVARQGAVITIAHRLSTVLEADLIILLDGGSLRAAGTHTTLLESDALYRDLVAALRIATTPTRVARS